MEKSTPGAGGPRCLRRALSTFRVAARLALRLGPSPRASPASASIAGDIAAGVCAVVNLTTSLPSGLTTNRRYTPRRRFRLEELEHGVRAERRGHAVDPDRAHARGR